MTPANPAPGQACQLFRATDIFVSTGVNHGDDLGGPEDVVPGDLYELDERAAPLRLVVAGGDQAGGGQTVAEGSTIGAPGDPVRLVARYTLMAPDGDKVDLLVLSVAEPGALFALPLAPMGKRIEYTLVKVDAAPADARLADLLCISFARGTMITLANGAQAAIETLKSGDRVLTRDHGAQPIRWLGKSTLRAVGTFAPVVISKGALGNAGDLIVSQHHRMFLYQRERQPGIRTAEVLVQAKHLVDGDRIFLREGGFVDYFSLVFDRHEIIYAEGVPAESLMVNDATVNNLPPAMAAEVKARFPGLTQNQHFGTEAGRNFLDSLGAAAIYRGGKGAAGR